MLYFTIAFAIIQILSQATARNQTNVIEALKKEKNDLLTQINKAIDETVHTLKTSNDSEAILGVSYMNELKDNLKESTVLENHKPTNDTRRHALSLTDLTNDIIGKRLKNNKKNKQKNENREEIQMKIDDWLEQRRLEKMKIKAYKQRKRQQIHFEKCPREGVGKKKKKTRRSNVRPRSRQKYPCCRKCCKSSYLGCL